MKRHETSKPYGKKKSKKRRSKIERRKANKNPDTPPSYGEYQRYYN